MATHRKTRKTRTAPGTTPGTCAGDITRILVKGGPKPLRDLLKALPKGRYTESTVKSTLSKGPFTSTLSPKKAGLRLWSIS